MADFTDWIKGRAAEGITSFSLPLEQASPTDHSTAHAFTPNDVYLEIRVLQIWLTQQRELWHEYLPFLAVVTSFTQRGEERTLPTLIGSSQLNGKLSLIEQDDAIEIRNIKVAGPTPYEGDEVTILVALFRTKTVDWLAQTLGVVEQISKAVGSSALIAVKPIADSIVSALTQFLGDKDLELRCGQYRGWPRADDPECPQATELQPMHYVVMRRPTKTEGSDGSGFTVRDGCLHFVDGEKTAPYTAHDFVLLSIEPKRVRDDYKKLDFYKFWEAAKERLAAGEADAAEREWRKTAGALYTDELTEPQQQALYAEYRRRYDEMSRRLLDAKVRGEPTAMPLDEEPDPVQIILSSAP